jgi:hypothetical protein
MSTFGQGRMECIGECAVVSCKLWSPLSSWCLSYRLADIAGEVEVVLMRT